MLSIFQLPLSDFLKTVLIRTKYAQFRELHIRYHPCGLHVVMRAYQQGAAHPGPGGDVYGDASGQCFCGAGFAGSSIAGHAGTPCPPRVAVLAGAGEMRHRDL